MPQDYLFRDIDQSDIDFIFTGLSHPDVIRYYGVSFATLEETQEQMDWYRELEEQKKGKWFVIERKQDGQLVGAGGFNDWDHTHRRAEIGYWLLPNFWRQGIMSATFPALVKYGFGAMNLHRIEGFVEGDNLACQRAISKLGFTLEGTMRQNEWKKGKWLNVQIWSLLSTD